MMLIDRLPDAFRGFIIMFAGFVLLLHTMGYLEAGLYYLLIGASIYMIISGFIIMDGFSKLAALFSKKDK